jgi:hypothetical protein
MLKFLWPLTTGDVWWQDGQIKEEEELATQNNANSACKTN